MTFTGNPFIKVFEASAVEEKYKIYYGENSSVPNTYTMLDHLNNVSLCSETRGEGLRSSCRLPSRREADASRARPSKLSGAKP